MAPTVRLIASLVTVLGAVGCGDFDRDGMSNADERAVGTDPKLPDSDGDGMSDGDEVAFGSDPLEVDSDGDRLDDLAEQELGADPLVPDSDGDGYADGDEATEGTDPLDATSVIYQGGWPYQWNKDSLVNGRLAGQRWRVGDRVGRLVQRDQHGDEVDLYDFALQGKYTLLDSSAMWCGPCQATSEWLATGSPNAGPGAVRQAVDSGALQWVTVLAEDRSGNVPTVDELQLWDDTYPHPNVPVIKDNNQRMVYEGVNISSGYIIFPQAALLDEQMIVVAKGSMTECMRAAADLLAE